jgi:hypothetical protein
LAQSLFGGVRRERSHAVYRRSTQRAPKGLGGAMMEAGVSDSAPGVMPLLLLLPGETGGRRRPGA